MTLSPKNVSHETMQFQENNFLPSQTIEPKNKPDQNNKIMFQNLHEQPNEPDP